MGREVFVEDWREVNTPLGLPGQRQAVCTRTVFYPLRDGLEPKPPEVHYYASSLPPHQADAGRLAALIRGHWGIENHLHHVKDRTFLEDRHWVKSPETALALTFLRTLVVGLLRQMKIPGRKSARVHCPEKIEYLQSDSKRPLRLVGCKL